MQQQRRQDQQPRQQPQEQHDPGPPSGFARLAQADLLHYIQSIAADQPLVILLEDLHWADPLSLEFILRVVQELPNSPILVVALTRPALFETRPAWGAGDFSQRIDLSPLTPEAATTLVRDILQKLEREGLIIVGRGRGGSKLTPQGEFYWQQQAGNQVKK